MCHAQVLKGTKLEVKQSVDFRLLEGKQITFAQLITYMLPPNDKLKGCQVLFPDTVFFVGGKPHFISKNDREGYLTTVTHHLGLQEIRQRFSTLVRERKKETERIVFGDKRDRMESPALEREDEVQNDEKSIYYKDTAIFRFMDEQAVKVVRDTEFINEFKRRANDPYWDTLDCIQTSVKARTGLGKPLFVHYVGPKATQGE